MKKEYKNVAEGGTSESRSNGVGLLLGNPKKAIVRLAIPSIISSLVGAIYEITDILWVSGLGADALAVMGYIAPFFLFAMAMASCFATGGGISVSHKIGENDKQGADAIGRHAFAVSLVLSIILFFMIIILAKPLLTIMGAHEVMETAVSMVYVIAVGIFVLMFSRVAASILYNEGDAKRAMLVSLTGVVLNIVLDPFFIYFLEMGVVGAILATLVSFSVASLLLIYWFFIKRDTYISIRFKGFRFRKELISTILKLGFPITMAQLIWPVACIPIIAVISDVGGTNGVAVFSTGSRIREFILLPTMGIAGALSTVIAAAYGARDFEKLKTSFDFALKVGLTTTLIISVFTYFVCPWIVSMFTWSKDAAVLTKELEIYLRLYSFYFIAIAIWATSVNFFVGIRRSILDFVFNFLKDIMLSIPLVYIVGSLLDSGLVGIWMVLIAGTWIQALSSLVVARMLISDFQIKVS